MAALKTHQKLVIVELVDLVFFIAFLEIDFDENHATLREREAALVDEFAVTHERVERVLRHREWVVAAARRAIIIICGDERVVVREEHRFDHLLLGFAAIIIDEIVETEMAKCAF